MSVKDRAAGGKPEVHVSAVALFDYFQDVGMERERFIEKCGAITVILSAEDAGLAKSFARELGKERGMEFDFPDC